MSDTTSIYLDHAASTPLLPGIAELWAATAIKHHANPTGSHLAARRARKALDSARFQVAETLGAAPNEIVFTSGGSEANNTAIQGTLRSCNPERVAATTAAEHDAVLSPVRLSEGVIIGVDSRGIVDFEDLTDKVRRHKQDIALVSVIAVNNEVGAITPLPEVASIVRKLAPKALLHTDAVQAVNWIDTTTATADYDLISVAAHKIGGPVGIGALVVRNGIELEPLIIGGGQQRERRAGTPDVASAVAFAAAIKETVDQRTESIERTTKLRDMIFDNLTERLGDRVIISAAGTGGSGDTGGRGDTGGGDNPPSNEPVKDDRSKDDRSHIAAGIANVCIEGVQNEALIFLLDTAGIQASAASSCSSGAQSPSHVLAAMGIPDETARGSLRLSLGSATTSSEVERAVDVIVDSVKHLDRYNGG